jgi:hypothetical protein
MSADVDSMRFCEYEKKFKKNFTSKCRAVVLISSRRHNARSAINKYIHQMTIKIDNATAVTIQDIVDFNSEFSDMGNPEGAIYGNVFLVYAETKHGARYSHVNRFDNLKDAEKLALRVNRHGVIDLDYWNQSYSVYGSSAWEGEEVLRRYDLQNAISTGDFEAIERLA